MPRAASPGGSIADVDIRMPPGNPGGTAIRAGGDITLDGTRVTAPTETSLSANGQFAPTIGSSVVATGVRLENAQIGASAGTKAGLVLSGARISAVSNGIQAFGGRQRRAVAEQHRGQRSRRQGRVRWTPS